MNYLELVQNLHRESGTGGPLPTTVVGNVGEAARLVYWIGRADIEIQNAHNDWDFMWVQDTFQTVAAQSRYLFAADVKTMDESSFFIDSLGLNLNVMDYLKVKDYPQDSTQGTPYQVILEPDRNMRLEAIPDAVYTVRHDYFRNPVAMAIDDAAVSLIPEAYHWAIIGKALTMYAMYENAPEAMQHGTQIFGEWMESLQSNQLPGHRDMHKQAEGNFWNVEVE